MRGLLRAWGWDPTPAPPVGPALGPSFLRSRRAAPAGETREAGPCLELSPAPWGPERLPWEGGRPSCGHTHLSSPEDISSLNSELSLLPGKGTQINERGSLAPEGPTPEGPVLPAQRVPQEGRGTAPWPRGHQCDGFLLPLLLPLCPGRVGRPIRPPQPSRGVLAPFPQPLRKPAAACWGLGLGPGSAWQLRHRLPLAHAKPGPGQASPGEDGGPVSTSALRGQGWSPVTEQLPSTRQEPRGRSPLGPWPCTHREGLDTPSPTYLSAADSDALPSGAPRDLPLRDLLLSLHTPEWPWRCHGSVHVAWAACWHRGRAAGKGAGGRFGPVGVTGKTGPVRLQTGHRHTQLPPWNFRLQTEKNLRSPDTGGAERVSAWRPPARIAGSAAEPGCVLCLGKSGTWARAQLRQVPGRKGAVLPPS